MRKKKILFLTDFAGAYTGFGKQAKLLLSYLYKTGKYELIHLAQGCRKGAPILNKFPWETEGCLPSQPEALNELNREPGLARRAAYGELEIENAVSKYRPDIILAINDTWGSQFVVDKAFSKKIPTICWNTFDSLPLLEETIKKANSIKHYWTWSDFARKEFHKLGFNHVKTQYPLVNTDNFYKLKDEEVLFIKNKFNLPIDSFIIGFVFRNQLRKLINTQIEAYSIFKKQNPGVKNTFLYTHTNYSEGWDILKLCKQYGVNPQEVLCTYVCKETKEYFILPFQGQNIKNPRTGKESLVTVSAEFGVSDQQLNEIYNIFSLYSHPATSGACELPCVEAALTEKIVTVPKYSFGEDIIEKNEGSLEMEFSFYTEHGTHFLKSQPDPEALASLFSKVFFMETSEKKTLESKSREWALKYYSINENGSSIDKFFDSIPLLNDEVELNEKSEKQPNPSAQIPNEHDEVNWIKSLYKFILNREVDSQDEGLLYWKAQLDKKTPRESIEDYFRKVAQKELSEAKVSLEEILDKADCGKRILLAVPGGKADVLYSTALLPSLKNKFPDLNIYAATNPENFSIFAGNKNIYRTIPLAPQMKNIPLMESDENKYFKFAFYLEPTIHHLHSKNYKIDFSLK
jgi:hypothetical protein